jgi:hypothetical protein
VTKYQIFSPVNYLFLNVTICSKIGQIVPHLLQIF